MHDMVIGEGVKIRVRFCRYCIKSGCRTLTEAVLGDHVTIIEGVKLKKGSRIMPGETVKNK